MKRTTVALSLFASILICSCGNSNTDDTTTDMPDSGYEQRSDTTAASVITSDSLPRGAVGVDTITMGRTNTAGVPDSANKKDSARK